MKNKTGGNEAIKGGKKRAIRLMKGIFHSCYSFYCSFTYAVLQLQKGTKQVWFYFRPVFSFRNLQTPRSPPIGEKDITMVAETEQKGGKKYRSTRRGRAPWQGWCIFSENTARTSSRHRRPREEWKNNILPFRPELPAFVPLLRAFSLLFVIT